MPPQPYLIIFDIDNTLIYPGEYTTVDEIRENLFDSQLLVSYLSDPLSYQVAIASFNQQQVYTKNGESVSVARAIIDLQSNGQVVEEPFIQSWIYFDPEMRNIYGKNQHISAIMKTYEQKYGTFPSNTIFYDDDILNCYLASRMGVHSYLVTNGLTRWNIYTLPNIDNRVQFLLFKDQLPKFYGSNFIRFSKFIITESYNITVFDNYKAREARAYALFLPMNQSDAKEIYNDFYASLDKLGIDITILAWDKLPLF